MDKEFNIETFATEYANERLDNYLKNSELEIEDYKIIANEQAVVGRGGRKKIDPEDQQFIDGKQKYHELFSTQQFRDYYVENLKNIFNSVDIEVIEFMAKMSKVDKALYKIEDKMVELVIDYANIMLGTQKMDA